MPPGVTVTALERNSEAVEQALDCSVDWWYDRRLVHMRAGVRRLPKSIEWSRFHGGSVVHEVPRVLCGWLLRIGGKRLRPLLGELVGVQDGVRARRRELPGELPLVVGISREGVKVMDLVELPHVLVGGVPGGGKSVFLRQALVGLLARFGPDRVRLALADFKGRLEFAIFTGVPHLLGPVAGDMVSFAALMQQVLAVLDRRLAMFEAAGVEKIQRWNEARPDQRLPYVVVAVEEIADVSAAEAYSEEARRVAKKDALGWLARLCRVGRALGFHVIVCTQRPDAEVVPGQIKANLPATVAFRVRGEVNSRILLGDGSPQAAALPPIPGRGIFQWGDTQVEFQAPYLGHEEARAALHSASWSVQAPWWTRPEVVAEPATDEEAA
jgi:hypothetical protein